MPSWPWPFLQTFFQRFRSPVRRRARIAVFIDCDGVSSRDAGHVLEQIPAIGRLCILRAYGNFTGGSASKWAKLMKTHGVIVRHMPSVAPKKNATDIALSIDAVEILLTRRIDTFVIIASDSDFAPLARRINEEGKDVFGYGNRSTPDAFRRACTEFQEFSLLTLQSSFSTPTNKLGSRLPADAEALLLAALTELGWAERPISLPDLGQHLAQQHPGFNSRIYSCRNLTELLLSLPSVELAEIDGQRRVRPARAKIRTG